MREQPTVPLKSTFAHDPDMRELVDVFVGELPQRIESLWQALAAQDAAGVRTMAHQLKGAAAGYGYPTIGKAAARVDEALSQAEALDKVRGSVEELLTLCRRAASTKP